MHSNPMKFVLSNRDCFLLPFLAFFCSPLMEDHPVKRRRIEEPAEAAQATVAQTREVGPPTSRYIGWTIDQRFGSGEA